MGLRWFVLARILIGFCLEILTIILRSISTTNESSDELIIWLYVFYFVFMVVLNVEYATVGLALQCIFRSFIKKLEALIPLEDQKKAKQKRLSFKEGFIKKRQEIGGFGLSSAVLKVRRVITQKLKDFVKREKEAKKQKEIEFHLNELFKESENHPKTLKVCVKKVLMMLKHKEMRIKLLQLFPIEDQKAEVNGIGTTNPDNSQMSTNWLKERNLSQIGRETDRQLDDEGESVYFDGERQMSEFNVRDLEEISDMEMKTRYLTTFRETMDAMKKEGVEIDQDIWRNSSSVFRILSNPQAIKKTLGSFHWDFGCELLAQSNGKQLLKFSRR